MLGLPGTFTYVVCASCASLYARDIPDLAEYYPTYYPAFRRARGLVSRVQQATRFAKWTRLFVGNPPPLDAAILDVGCGSGMLLDSLAARGYRNLTGIDAYAGERDDAVRILRAGIEAMTGAYDVIIFDHSLEHVTDPAAALRDALARLRGPESILVVRIPIVNDAFRIYGADWVQLDAPRHTFVPSEHGLCALLGTLGATALRVTYDSTAFQFWGSECYRRGDTLADATGTLSARVWNEMAGTLRYAARARSLNASSRGDQAALIVRSGRSG